MKNSVSGRLGALLLVACTAFALPAHAADPSRQGQMGSGMSERTPKPVDGYSSQTQSSTGGMHGDGPAAQQVSGLINEMASEMKNMAGMMESGNMSPDMMKKMSSRMKQMGGMMNHMSGMMHKGMTMNAGTQKEMGRMRKQMEHMRKDMPASSMQK